ncbi:hypothetical protein DLM46_07650 [Paraburkholderia lacunae]|uniref:Uncharacterized protein n=1 Tax=Paraburkholderia lacunae TaxID=2211104 RepID=A0A370NCQ6_9BURK|nr:hypothetical protein DLM46_07650 [Paraburkholderia lacunae]
MGWLKQFSGQNIGGSSVRRSRAAPGGQSSEWAAKDVAGPRCAAGTAQAVRAEAGCRAPSGSVPVSVIEAVTKAVTKAVIKA